MNDLKDLALARQASDVIFISTDIYRCLIPDLDKEVAKFLAVKNQASINALKMSADPRRTLPQTGASAGRSAVQMSQLNFRIAISWLKNWFI